MVTMTTNAASGKEKTRLNDSFRPVSQSPSPANVATVRAPRCDRGARRAVNEGGQCRCTPKYLPKRSSIQSIPPRFRPLTWSRRLSSRSRTARVNARTVQKTTEPVTEGIVSTRKRERLLRASGCKLHPSVQPSQHRNTSTTDGNRHQTHPSFHSTGEHLKMRVKLSCSRFMQPTLVVVLLCLVVLLATAQNARATPVPSWGCEMVFRQRYEFSLKVSK